MSYELSDVLASLDREGTPWMRVGKTTEYRSDRQALRRLLEVPVSQHAPSQSGRAAKAVDAWVANEFRRAGFDPDAIWPRAEPPFVLPLDVRNLLHKLTSGVEKQVAARLLNMPSVAPRDGNFLGRAYVKQVDVSMSHWSTGPELLVSTKMMTASFGKNLANRFEEAYGDAGNLRARYPLAAVGFIFVLHASITTTEPAAFAKAVDMMRKLRNNGDGNGYTATCLILVDWDESQESPVVSFPEAEDPEVDPSAAHSVPEDLSADRFFEKMVHHILDAAPVSFHAGAREKLNRAR
ncbi:MAG: hypothetical protein Q4G50_08545 [Corynebacterium sp.]|uniref:hypothetical protein n=1 Tax=Corynebacterium sp. TaxID=1720 RepID=UPI0026DFD4C8|nr:hypothetical protein [Corynebacterium sp.]MDO5670037.1 hypothetical protein [Corynebacterium sp.]